MEPHEILIQALDANTRSNEAWIAMQASRTKTLRRMNWFIGICLTLNLLMMAVSLGVYLAIPEQSEIAPSLCESAAKAGSFLLKIGAK